eukprot:6469560-Amphidinium_carterae.1
MAEDCFWTGRLDRRAGHTCIATLQAQLKEQEQVQCSVAETMSHALLLQGCFRAVGHRHIGIASEHNHFSQDCDGIQVIEQLLENEKELTEGLDQARAELVAVPA